MHDTDPALLQCDNGEACGSKDKSCIYSDAHECRTDVPAQTSKRDENCRGEKQAIDQGLRLGSATWRAQNPGHNSWLSGLDVDLHPYSNCVCGGGCSQGILVTR